jgi:hypothetical protein
MDCQSVEADLNANNCSPDGVLPNLAAITNWWIELFGLGIRQMLTIIDHNAL